MPSTIPPGQRTFLCSCSEPVHVGSVMRSWSEPDQAGYEAIVIHVGPQVPEPMHRSLHVVVLTSLSQQHRGDLLTWQAEVGEPVRCATAADIPPPCAFAAPACQDDRRYRLAWERRTLVPGSPRPGTT